MIARAGDTLSGSLLPNADMDFELTLIITERCNLRCSYCFCDKTRTGSMSPETAVNIIRQTAAEHPGATICILFFGGEPLLDFECIRQTAEALEHDALAGRLRYKIVTNGTLLTPEICEWIRHRSSSFALSVSADGDAATQEAHRHGSFDRIDFGLLRSLGGVEIKTVVMPDTIGMLADNVIGFAKQGFSVQCELADGIAWDESFCTVYAQQLQRLIEFYLKNPSLHPVSPLTAAFELVEMPEERIGRCKPGVTSCAFDANGVRYDCQRCMPYYNNGPWSIPDGLSSMAGMTLTDGCGSCTARNLCNACPASTVLLRKSPEQSAIRCQMTKIALWAAANFALRAVAESPENGYLRAKKAGVRTAFIRGARKIWESLN